MVSTMPLRVAVAIPPGFGLVRAEDLEAIKAAVLYGDEVVVLMHLSTHMTTGLFMGVPEAERAAFLLRCVHPKVVTRAGYPTELNALTTRLASTVNDFQLLGGSARVRLDLILEDGVYRSVDIDGEPALVVQIDPGMERFAERIGELIVADEGLNLVLPARGLSAGFIQEQGLGRRGHMGLGMELVSRLPGFGSATLAEVLDIRDELANSLARFRSALIELSAHRQEGGNEIESIWLAVVEPALQELDEAVDENRYLRRLTERLLNPADGITSLAGIAVGFSALHGVPEMMAAGLSVALPAFRAGWDRRLGTERLKQHRLFFLYGARQRIGRSER